MRILGLDTSTSHSSVAIVENGELLVEKMRLSPLAASAGNARLKDSPAEILLPLIEMSLREAALSLDDLEGFAAATGPGSFTGLRIGLSTVKGLTYGHAAASIVGVSTLQACAARLTEPNGVICAVLDAQRDKVYTAIFRAYGGSMERLSDDSLMSLEELAEALLAIAATEQVVLTGDGMARHGEWLVNRLAARSLTIRNDNLPTIAAAVALLGESYIKKKETLSPAALAPRYLRRPQAEVNAQKVNLSC